MPYYFVRGEQDAVTSAYKSAVEVWSPASGKRGKVCEINLGTLSNPNPTDTYLDWDISRITGTGTSAGTAFTANPMDPADGVAINTAIILVTAESSLITANSSLKRWGMNQRNSLRWVAQQESQMIVWPATASNGLVLRVLSSTFTASATGTIDFME